VLPSTQRSKLTLAKIQIAEEWQEKYLKLCLVKKIVEGEFENLRISPVSKNNCTSLIARP
jgi:hypothetical protein